jgi:ketosteroid isomerase-like protein
MELKNIFPLVILFLVFGCKDNDDARVEKELVSAEQEIQDPGESMNQWNEAWNSNNANNLKQLMADDAVVVLFSDALQDRAVETWLDSTSTWMKDLETMPIMTHKGKQVAYEVGSYRHGTTRNDTLRMEGTYTVIWNRNKDLNEWEVKVMDVSPKMPQDSLQMQQR